MLIRGIECLRKLGGHVVERARTSVNRGVDASLAAFSASLESLMPLLACSINRLVDSSTVPVCWSIPLADVNESDVELKMPASDEAFA